MDETAPVRNCKAVEGGMNAIDVQESPQATSYRLSREAVGQSGGRATDTRATFVLIQTLSSRAYAPVGRKPNPAYYWSFTPISVNSYKKSHIVPEFSDNYLI